MTKDREALDALAYALYMTYGSKEAMKLKEHTYTFDPKARAKEAKPLIVTFTPEEWAKMESEFGRHVTRDEIKELILGVFSNKYKLTKR